MSRAAVSPASRTKWPARRLSLFPDIGRDDGYTRCTNNTIKYRRRVNTSLSRDKGEEECTYIERRASGINYCRALIHVPWSGDLSARETKNEDTARDELFLQRLTLRIPRDRKREREISRRYAVTEKIAWADVWGKRQP